MSMCANCLSNADRAWIAEQAADEAIRCCETGHRPAYRRGRVAGQHDVERAARRGYLAGRRHGLLVALLAVGLLGLAAIGMRRGR